MENLHVAFNDTTMNEGVSYFALCAFVTSCYVFTILAVALLTHTHQILR